MSLSDRYNRGGGRLANLDRYLTEVGNRLGNQWLDRTGVSRHVLTRGLFLFAAWSALQNLVISHNVFMIIFAGQAMLSLAGLAASRGGLVEQIQAEAFGLPKSTFALVRIFILFLGGFSLATAFGQMGSALVAGVAIPFSATDSLFEGAALVALQAGEYIRRTNPPTLSNGHGTRI